MQRHDLGIIILSIIIGFIIGNAIDSTSAINDIELYIETQNKVNAELRQLLTDGLQETRSRLSIEIHCQLGDRGACDILGDRLE